MRLKIGRNGQPVLTLPFWIPKKVGLLWAQKQQSWIQEHCFVPVRFYENQKILFLGQEVIIRHCEGHTPTHIRDNVLWVSGEKEFLPRRVADFIKKEFLIYLRPVVSKKENHLGVHHSRLTLRDTSSRWGSCSSNGTISFCWRLAMSPEFVIDYLVAHEISHLKYMNHSPQFWETVNQLTDCANEAKKWLKQNGHLLPTLK